MWYDYTFSLFILFWNLILKQNHHPAVLFGSVLNTEEVTEGIILSLFSPDAWNWWLLSDTSCAEGQEELETPQNKSGLSKLTQLMQFYQNKSKLSFKIINNDTNNNINKSILKFSRELLVLLTLLLVLQACLQAWAVVGQR